MSTMMNSDNTFTSFKRPQKKQKHPKGNQKGERSIEAFTESQPIEASVEPQPIEASVEPSIELQPTVESQPSVEPTVESQPTSRAPICSIVGHVDHGKTSLLDRLRGSKLQQDEAGGITQHIGSTLIPSDKINEQCSSIKGKFEVKSDSDRQLLFIDTPGHKHFTQSRFDAMQSTDLGILIIDINEGIKPQTEEAIKILLANKTPFVIATTKLDKVNGWVSTDCSNLTDAFKKQGKTTILQIESSIGDIKYELSKLGVESEFYFKNKKPEKVFSIVPVSSKTNEGIADLLALLVYISNNWMVKKLAKKDTFKCQILETKYDKQNGYTIDVILINGIISVGDKFAVPTVNGSVISTVRSIMEPAPLTQLGKKTSWTRRESVEGAIGVKLFASNLEGSYSGIQIFKVQKSENGALEKANAEIDKIWKSYDFKPKGVFVCTQTLNELDACYKILTESQIPVANAFVSTPSVKIIDRINGITESEELLENKLLLFFGTSLNEDVIEYAKSKDIKILASDIIYKLPELYNLEKDQIIKERQANAPPIFPVKLQIIKKFIFMRGGAEHLMFGAKVIEGTLHKNTPICVPEKKTSLGKIVSIQKDKKELQKADVGQEVCIRLSNPDGVSIGRHFEDSDTLISMITRESIDILKRDYKEVVTKTQWEQIIKYKKLLGIP